MGEVFRTAKGKKNALRAGIPRHLKDMSQEQLQLALMKKRECNARALQIVERLLENTVSEDWFLDCLKFISESHFQDVIEERAILSLCGYPLCHQGLKNVPNQQYRISTKLNKVYDITERKNFCSNQCYKASKCIKDQLLSSPLWLRDKEEMPHFRVLPVNFSGVGEEVDIGQKDNTLKEEVTKLTNGDSFTSVALFAQASLSELSKKIDKLEEKERKEGKKEEKAQKEVEKNKSDIPEMNAHNNTSNPSSSKEDSTLGSEDIPAVKVEVDTEIITTSFSSLAVVDDVSTQNIIQKDYAGNSEQNDIHNDINNLNKETLIQVSVCDETHIKRTNGDINIIVVNNAEPLQKPAKKEKTKNKSEDKAKWSKKKLDEIPALTSSVIHIEKCLYEWFTIDTMCFLFGEDKVKELVIDKGECLKEYYKAVGSVVRNAEMHERYQAICRRLNLLELEENKFDSEARELKPLPDYTILKEEGKRMDLKVQAFYQGMSAYEVVESPTSVKETPEDSSCSVILPLVDLHAQNALRRRIVLDRLNRVLPDLLRTFGLSSRDVGTDVRSLVSTFSLGASNITFKPAEWSLIGLVIIKMLSIKDMQLKMILDTEQATKYQIMMLMAFHQDGGYLERLMVWLTDMDNILQKQPRDKGQSSSS